MPFHNPSSLFRYLPHFSQIIPYNPRTHFSIGGEAKTCKDHEALPFKDSHLKVGGLCPQLHSMAPEPVLKAAAARFKFDQCCSVTTPTNEFVGIYGLSTDGM